MKTGRGAIRELPRNVQVGVAQQVGIKKHAQDVHRAIGTAVSESLCVESVLVVSGHVGCAVVVTRACDAPVANVCSSGAVRHCAQHLGKKLFVVCRCIVAVHEHGRELQRPTGVVVASGASHGTNCFAPAHCFDHLVGMLVAIERKQLRLVTVEESRTIHCESGARDVRPLRTTRW